MDTLSLENQRMQKKLNSILKDMSEEERLKYGGGGEELRRSPRSRSVDQK